LVGLVGLMNIQCVHSAEATKKLAEGKEFCLLMGDGVGDCTMADGLEIETLKVPWLKSGKIQLQHLNGKNQCFVHGHLFPAMSISSPPEPL